MSRSEILPQQDICLQTRINFNDIAERLMSVNESVLGSLIECMKKGSVKPETDEEKKYFYLLSDLNTVNYKVQRSITSKKDRKSTRLNSSHSGESRMPSSA